MTTLLIIPGLGGSGERHWQTRFEALYRNARRVEQDDWDTPDLAQWSLRLERAVDACTGPVVLVAHSLGCILVARWAQEHDARKVHGALLVAPADVEREDAPPPIRGFAPIPTKRLPFPSTVVYSEDDPFASAERSRAMASAWGAEPVSLGAAGHINADSGLGSWPDGQRLLEARLRSTPFELDAQLAADTIAVGESNLCALRLLDDSRYPWLVLVPKRAGIVEPFELPPADQHALMEETAHVGRVLQQEFGCDKINTGALGNVVRQLHVHVIGRRLGDPAWPGPVWGHSPRVPYSPPARQTMLARLQSSALGARFG